jgi:hypothetical protein
MSCPYYGDYPANHTAVCIPFGTFAAATGANSVTTNFAAADVVIFKDGSATERTSANGITVTTSFNSITGGQMIVIDLSDNTDSGFYAAGHEFSVFVGPITVDGQTLTFPVAAFSIERALGALAVAKAIKVISDAIGATAAARLALTLGNSPTGTVDNTGFTPTTTAFEASDITEATAVHYNGRVVLATSGASAGMAGLIADYSLASGRGHFTVSTLAEAWANGTTFIII